VVDGSPVDLGRIIRVRRPIINVQYDYEDVGGRMARVLERFLTTIPA